LNVTINLHAVVTVGTAVIPLTYLPDKVYPLAELRAPAGIAGTIGGYRLCNDSSIWHYMHS
jgi:hypothetical protein